MIARNWQEQEGKLSKTFEFADFDDAWDFMQQVAVLFKKMDHHARWTNEYNQVSLELQTHDAGGVVTDKDRVLASAIDKLVK
jgi:4a-hydroxytetrahydrobiopterin dehydratase